MADLEKMDDSEKRVFNYLTYIGYTNIVFEPDGNIPPDFLIDGKIAVEVRRLNRHYIEGKKPIGFDVDATRWINWVENLALSFGDPEENQSYYVDFSFNRPLGKFKTLNSKFKKILQDFKDNPTNQKVSYDLGNGFGLKIYPASIPFPTFYVLAHPNDNDDGAFFFGETIEDIKICLDEKTKKTKDVKSKYPEWWLILDNYITYDFSDSEKQSLTKSISFKDIWNKVISVNPLDPTMSFEI